MGRSEVTGDVAARAEELARVAYGRLLAILAAADGDIESAEDCLADAFAQALLTWPAAGIPGNPAAWLLTVARNRRLDFRRSAAHRLTGPLDEAAQRGTPAIFQEFDPDAIPDRLYISCIDPALAVIDMSWTIGLPGTGRSTVRRTLPSAPTTTYSMRLGRPQ